VSSQASYWARDQRTGSSPCKCVLLVLAEQVDQKRTCFIAIATIAKRAELGRTTVIKALRDLERLGLIARRRRHSAFGQRTSDEIELLFGSVSSGPPVGPGTAAQSSPVGPTPSAKVHGEASLSSPGAREKVIEKRKSARASVQQSETLIPESFPDREAMEREQGFLRDLDADLNIRIEAEKFRSHARDVARTSADWPAAFHRWVINSMERRPGSFIKPSGSAARERTSETDIWSPRMREWSANRYWNRMDWGPPPGREGCQVPSSILENFSTPRAGGRGGVET
jgi:hypothetical protein